MEILHIFSWPRKTDDPSRKGHELGKSHDGKKLRGVQFSAHLILAHRVLGCELAVVKVHARHGGGHQAQDEDHRGHLDGGCHCVKSLS